MNKRIFLICLISCTFIFPLLAAASDWMIFTPKQKDGFTWFYDKTSIVYMKNRVVIGITMPFRDANEQKMWIRASSDSGEKIYQVELKCKERTAKMLDNNGKGIYNLPAIDYLYERPIPPDTVLDMLRKAVCR
jgi:hypothetical protein